jgi:hypothetical protein
MSDNLTKSLTQVITEDLETSQYASNSNTFFGLTFTTWIIIIFILALLGFNIFAYLAKGTDITTNIFNTYFLPVLQWFGYKTVETTKQTIDVSTIGLDTTLEATKQTIDTSATGVNVIANTSTSAIGEIQSTINKEFVPVQDSIQQNHYDTDSWALQQALDDAPKSTYIPNETGQSGWCYIGEHDGFRACAQVGVNDKCMSGDVFPTRDICMNPKLRM